MHKIKNLVFVSILSLVFFAAGCSVRDSGSNGGSCGCGDKCAKSCSQMPEKSCGCGGHGKKAKIGISG